MNFQEMKAVVGEISAKKRGLEQKREKLIQRREWLESAPPCREDMVAFLQNMLDDQEALYKKKLQLRLNDTIFPRGMKRPLHGFPLFAPWGGDSVSTTDYAVIALLKKPILDRLPEIVDELEFPENAGPRFEDRKLEIEKIDAEIAELDGAIAEINREANDAGIKLQ